MALGTNHEWRRGIKLPADNKARPVAAAMLGPRPVIDFVLPGLGVAEVGMLVAPGAAGKSFWALQAAIAIATGIDLLKLDGMGGYRLQPGRVLYLSMEDSAEVVKGRLHDIANTFPALQRLDVLQAIDDNLAIVSGTRGDFDLLTMASAGIDLTACATTRRLLILDTLSMSHTGDENKTSEMAAVVGNAQRLARSTRCSVLMLHHAAKSAVLNGQMDMQQAARGATALVDNIRCAFFMQTMTEDEAKAMGVSDRFAYVRYGSTKLNHGSHVAPLWYQKQTGSGVLVATDLQPNTKTKKQKTLERHGAGGELIL
jgi:RecA-family ATPase